MSIKATIRIGEMESARNHDCAPTGFTTCWQRASPQP